MQLYIHTYVRTSARRIYSAKAFVFTLGKTSTEKYCVECDLACIYVLHVSFPVCPLFNHAFI